ncbi:hypothetical protein ACE2AJ_17420 [Aquihabitans daechungensis]|uniref:hypothetical protein n=1 Tax=Aquihabitans daechungensis TaxID=1052257 RepID=UPI003B9E7651
MFRKMLIGALMLVAVAAAPAAAQTYDFNVSPANVEPGGTVTVSGEGCQPGAEVTITVTEAAPQRAVGDVILTTTVTADGSGQFTATFTIPSGTATGTYEVTATCGDGVVLSDFINVVDGTVATTAPPSGSGGGGTIARTGSDLNGLGLAGAGLITVGGIILLTTRSRRHQAKA